MKTVSLSTNNRPDYLRRTLEALKANTGVAGWTLVVSQEACAECQKIIDEVDWMPKIVSVNRYIMGVTVNTFLAAQLAFRLGGEFNVYLEDDMILSPDALALADAYRLFPGSKESTLLALRRRIQNLDQPEVVSISDEEGLFNCGWCAHAEQWPMIRSHWFDVEPFRYKGECWDLSLGYFLLRTKAKVWRPMVNRSQHIGINGTHTRAENFVNEPLTGPCYSGRETEFQFHACST